MFSGFLMVTVFAFRVFFLSGPSVADYFVVGLQLCTNLCYHDYIFDSCRCIL